MGETGRADGINLESKEDGKTFYPQLCPHHSMNVKKSYYLLSCLSLTYCFLYTTSIIYYFLVTFCFLFFVLQLRLSLAGTNKQKGQQNESRWHFELEDKFSQSVCQRRRSREGELLNGRRCLLSVIQGFIVHLTDDETSQCVLYPQYFCFAGWHRKVKNNTTGGHNPKKHEDIGRMLNKLKKAGFEIFNHWYGILVV